MDDSSKKPNEGNSKEDYLEKIEIRTAVATESLVDARIPSNPRDAWANISPTSQPKIVPATEISRADQDAQELAEATQHALEALRNADTSPYRAKPVAVGGAFKPFSGRGETLGSQESNVRTAVQASPAPSKAKVSMVNVAIARKEMGLDKSHQSRESTAVSKSQKSVNSQKSQNSKTNTKSNRRTSRGSGCQTLHTATANYEIDLRSKTATKSGPASGVSTAQVISPARSRVRTPMKPEPVAADDNNNNDYPPLPSETDPNEQVIELAEQPNDIPKSERSTPIVFPKQSSTKTGRAHTPNRSEQSANRSAHKRTRSKSGNRSATSSKSLTTATARSYKDEGWSTPCKETNVFKDNKLGQAQSTPNSKKSLRSTKQSLRTAQNVTSIKSSQSLTTANDRSFNGSSNQSVYIDLGMRKNQLTPAKSVKTAKAKTPMSNSKSPGSVYLDPSVRRANNENNVVDSKSSKTLPSSSSRSKSNSKSLKTGISQAKGLNAQSNVRTAVHVNSATGSYASVTGSSHTSDIDSATRTAISTRTAKKLTPMKTVVRSSRATPNKLVTSPMAVTCVSPDVRSETRSPRKDMNDHAIVKEPAWPYSANLKTGREISPVRKITNRSSSVVRTAHALTPHNQTPNKINENASIRTAREARTPSKSLFGQSKIQNETSTRTGKARTPAKSPAKNDSVVTARESRSKTVQFTPSKSSNVNTARERSTKSSTRTALSKTPINKNNAQFGQQNTSNVTTARESRSQYSSSFRTGRERTPSKSQSLSKKDSLVTARESHSKNRTPAKSPVRIPEITVSSSTRTGVAVTPRTASIAKMNQTESNRNPSKSPAKYTPTLHTAREPKSHPTINKYDEAALAEIPDYTTPVIANKYTSSFRTGRERTPTSVQDQIKQFESLRTARETRSPHHQLNKLGYKYEPPLYTAHELSTKSPAKPTQTTSHMRTAREESLYSPAKPSNGKLTFGDSNIGRCSLSRSDISTAKSNRIVRTAKSLTRTTTRSNSNYSIVPSHANQPDMVISTKQSDGNIQIELSFSFKVRGENDKVDKDNFHTTELAVNGKNIYID